MVQDNSFYHIYQDIIKEMDFYSHFTNISLVESKYTVDLIDAINLIILIVIVSMVTLVVIKLLLILVYFLGITIIIGIKNIIKFSFQTRCGCSLITTMKLVWNHLLKVSSKLIT